ncbi:xanthine dehydrogenase accessory protein XdhC [Pseudooceanicola sediminis]|uniref:Xanthine dehydrogenase accessory protein XdhC n=1 Tax=Pseudooceanicola sediminis TaxID=2211117 RepID=A0A399J5X5_9RHOB|nr:xanthine dehydrogenase accessory protein XdhC [Pseudooceanicola sediminis]KAA2314663.1 xanthine dehydrogenase accessory protein XdhC [Puniceibacterium sp. HSS470]RII39382.1 xanthine dehydrogenase accessory protein XdhC [Pseudooceanicola sediminis]|tara:strand:+ start:248144 stop:249091 length:948 start_codon:yes stop_codon:yes gene_type:complete
MFDLVGLRRAVAQAGRVVRVVVAETRGSVPREAGAAMLVGACLFEGTIGGGTLEHKAMLRARAMLEAGDADRLEKRALGPDLGQCCGGAVTLLYEVYDAARVAGLDEVMIARGAGEMPFAVKRLLARMRAGGDMPPAQRVAGWMVEPVARPEREVWVWGAGHVGRAIVSVLAPLPGVAVTWVDTEAARFPGVIPEGVTMLPAAEPARLAAHAPRRAEHLILTYSHALDLALCDTLLGRGFARCGLIGSASKWARFRRRLSEMGHDPARIASIDCPIGAPELGKHPQEIAVGVAAAILRQTAQQDATRPGEVNTAI